MPRLLHLADLHLGYEHRYLGSRAAEGAAERVMTLQRIVTWALEPKNDIAAVLIAGDLFETHTPDTQLAGAVIAELGKLTAAGKTLVTVPGNHDEYSYPESVYRRQEDRWPGVLVTNPLPDRVATFDLDKTRCHVYAQAFTAGLSPKILPGFSTSADGPDNAAAHTAHIALLHGTLDANPNDRSYRIDSGTLTKAGISYAALGHIHKPDERRIGDGRAVYPGTPIGKGFDDPGSDTLVAVSFPGGTPLIERELFPTRKIETHPVDLSRYDTLESLIAELEEGADADLILRLELVGPRPAGYDADHLRGRLRGHYYHLEIDDLSVGLGDEEIDVLAHQPTIKGSFVQRIRQQIAEAVEAGDETRMRDLRAALHRGITAFEGARPVTTDKR